MGILRHPSVAVSIGAGAAIVGASVLVDVPWPLWVAWVALSAIAVRQAVRDRHA